MRFAKSTRLVTLLLAISCANCAGLAPKAGTPPLAVQLPPPPKFMAACPPSSVKEGDPPNQAFDAEHAALKACSRQGLASRNWYLRLRKKYAAPTKE